LGEFAATRYFQHEESEVAPRDRLAQYALATAKPPGIEQLMRRYADNRDRDAQTTDLPGTARKRTRAGAAGGRIRKKRTPA
jgi:hypothetical protein